MNIVTQFIYSAKRILKDTKPILTKIITFIIIILILGSAFSKSFDTTTIDKVKIIFYNEDAGSFGDEFISMMKDNEQILSLADMEEVDSFEEGQSMIEQEEADGLIHIPDGFSTMRESGDESKSIEVYLQQYTGVNSMVVQNIIESFVNGMNTAGAVYRMTGSLANFNFVTSDSIKEMPLSQEIQPTAMGYYAVAMLLMMILYGADYGKIGIDEDYLGVLGDRIKLSPMKPVEQYIGKITGLSFVTFLQSLVIILFTKVVYDVNWGNDFALLMLITFTFSILATVFGAMLTIVTKDVTKAGSIVSLAITGFTFLAGGFIPVDFGNIAGISPSYYAKTALFEMIYNNNIDIVYLNVGIMWVIILVFAVISIVSARRKRA